MAETITRNVHAGRLVEAHRPRLIDLLPGEIKKTFKRLRRGHKSPLFISMPGSENQSYRVRAYLAEEERVVHLGGIRRDGTFVKAHGSVMNTVNSMPKRIRLTALELMKSSKNQLGFRRNGGGYLVVRRELGKTSDVGFIDPNGRYVDRLKLRAEKERLKKSMMNRRVRKALRRLREEHSGKIHAYFSRSSWSIFEYQGSNRKYIGLITRSGEFRNRDYRREDEENSLSLRQRRKLGALEKKYDMRLCVSKAEVGVGRGISGYDKILKKAVYLGVIRPDGRFIEKRPQGESRRAA